MTSSENYQVVSGSSPIRERVGLAIDGANAAGCIKTIVAAEDAGVRQIWMVQPPNCCITNIGDNLAYRHRLHFCCQEVYQHRNRNKV